MNHEKDCTCIFCTRFISRWRVQCYESSEDIKSSVYDPNGNALTNGELCALINQLLDEAKQRVKTL